MAFKTIMGQLDVDSIAAPRTAIAWDLAQRHEADLIGFCAAEPHFVMPTGTDDCAAARAIWAQVEELEGRLNCLEEEFLSTVNGSNRASWRGEIGNPSRQLAINARAADLIITGPPIGNLVFDRHRTLDTASVILAAGRPVLVAAKGTAPIKADSILIAWNDTREARRAVADAMPLLIHARDVVIATVDRGSPTHSGTTADVEHFLARHGVKARSEVLDARCCEPADVLGRISQEMAADLIVLGGYGHSRIRERTFGGVTRSLLRTGSIHRFISH
ncbi:universal stress protein [Mesorhizobium sp. M0491]|uniref:universal stress protein n=1 Tax=Mesorhizobium sp. M0491 TaxID=2956950 RepID=UPI00333C744C